jgi:hypothetical protein
VTFLAAMTVGIGLMGMGEDRRPGGFPLTSLGSLTTSTTSAAIVELANPIDRDRWQTIVLHDLGAPAGSPESMHRWDRSRGLDGLGHHFVIGNGNGFGDGQVHVGYRWDQQLTGAHLSSGATVDPGGAIGICLIGNGTQSPFTVQQMRAVIRLVRSLQQELGISRTNVVLDSQIDASSSSPGRFFSRGQLEQQLLDS